MAGVHEVPDHLQFEVKVHKSGSIQRTKYIDVDLENYTISISKKRKKQNDKEGVVFPATMIEMLEKISDNEKAVRVFWNPESNLIADIRKSSTSKGSSVLLDEKRKVQVSTFSFKSIEERERFYEAAYYAKYQGKIQPSSTEDITIWIGTWNLGNAPPPSSLAPWVPKDKYDIYYFALQESNYSTPSGYSSSDAHLRATLINAVGPQYTLLEEANLWEIRFYLFVRLDHVFKISNIETSTEATGIAHVVGNKGGVGVAFQFHETTFCFVSSHLAAHQTKAELRNSNFKEIVEGLRLGNLSFDITNHFHYAFWAGDLNYRIDLDRDVVLDLIKKKDYDTLLAADQLLKQRREEAAFADWKEGKITFPPTYRYNRGNRTYSDERARIPAWCDRVLWKTLPNLEAVQIEYNCCNDIMTSDHSPVYAVFRVTTKLPNIPHRPEHCSIYITNLKGENLKLTWRQSMDRNGLSDPYVVFTAPFLSGLKQTIIIEKTLNPCYRDEDLPVLKPFITNREFLKSQFLFMIVRDHDDLSKDDEMGQAAVSLRDACGEFPVPFECRVVDKGYPYGKLRGMVHVSWSLGKRKPRMQSEYVNAPPVELEAAERAVGLVNTADRHLIRAVLRSLLDEDLNTQRAFLAAAINGNAKAFVPKLAQLFENQQKVLEEEARKKSLSPHKEKRHDKRSRSRSPAPEKK